MKIQMPFSSFHPLKKHFFAIETGEKRKKIDNLHITPFSPYVYENQRNNRLTIKVKYTPPHPKCQEVSAEYSRMHRFWPDFEDLTTKPLNKKLMKGTKNGKNYYYQRTMS
ncbi:MAG: hypothetical protein ABII09_01465 [Planctomycetota bacterium]